MAQTATQRIDHVLPHMPVQHWVRVCQVRLLIPLRLLLAAQPKLVTPVRQLVYRVITRFLLDQAGLKAEQMQRWLPNPQAVDRLTTMPNLQVGEVAALDMVACLATLR